MDAITHKMSKLDINQTHIVNPKTNRLIKIGSASWKKAVLDGHLPITDDFIQHRDPITGKMIIYALSENKIMNPDTGKPIVRLGKLHKQLIREKKLPLPDDCVATTIKRKDGAEYLAIKKIKIEPPASEDEEEQQGLTRIISKYKKVKIDPPPTTEEVSEDEEEQQGLKEIISNSDIPDDDDNSDEQDNSEQLEGSDREVSVDDLFRLAEHGS